MVVFLQHLFYTTCALISNSIISRQFFRLGISIQAGYKFTIKIESNTLSFLILLICCRLFPSNLQETNMAISNHDLVGHFGVVHGLIQAKMESVEDLGFFETKTVDQIIVFELNMSGDSSLRNLLLTLWAIKVKVLYKQSTFNL